MRMRLAAGFVWIAPLLLGQLDTNSVTVTASNSATLQPDQVVFSVEVDSGLNATLDDVVAALQGSGITAANFTGINNGLLPTTLVPQTTIAWLFSLSAPLAKIKDTVSQLTNLQQSIAKQNNGLKMSFSVQGTQVSQQLQQSQPCVLSDLLANARTQAQNLASAAGFGLDVIQAMSSTITTSVSGQGQEGLSSFRLGAAAAPCTVTVKFGLVRQ
ncbi:MAG TPA: hypothetical protein VLW25_11190 [Bryobacteraceae bacterium]|nr:hypothetical protein [Bryobacteraceae bacterium]